MESSKDRRSRYLVNTLILLAVFAAFALAYLWIDARTWPPWAKATAVFVVSILVVPTLVRAPKADRDESGDPPY